MAKAEIPVKGMSCGGCERRVAQALTRLEGVRGAKAERLAERVTVSYDPKRVDDQTLREQIELCGYEVVA